MGTPRKKEAEDETYAMSFPDPTWLEYSLTASSSFSLRRPEMYTVAPFEASARAVVSPKPVPPPVTSATFPVRSKSLDAEREDMFADSF